MNPSNVYYATHEDRDITDAIRYIFTHDAPCAFSMARQYAHKSGETILLTQLVDGKHYIDYRVKPIYAGGVTLNPTPAIAKSRVLFVLPNGIPINGQPTYFEWLSEATMSDGTNQLYRYGGSGITPSSLPLYYNLRTRWLQVLVNVGVEWEGKYKNTSGEMVRRPTPADMLANRNTKMGKRMQANVQVKFRYGRSQHSQKPPAEDTIPIHIDKRNI